MSHPRHLEPFPSWKENKGESGDKTSPCVEGVEGGAPSGQTSWKGGCRVTSGAPGDLEGPGEGAGWCQSKTPSLSPLLCSSVNPTLLPGPFSFSFLPLSSPISHSFISMTTYSPGLHAVRPHVTPNFHLLILTFQAFPAGCQHTSPPLPTSSSPPP